MASLFALAPKGPEVGTPMTGLVGICGCRPSWPPQFVPTTLFEKEPPPPPAADMGRNWCRPRSLLVKMDFNPDKTTLGLERNGRTNSGCGLGRHRIPEMSWRPPSNEHFVKQQTSNCFGKSEVFKQTFGTKGRNSVKTRHLC